MNAFPTSSTAAPSSSLWYTGDSGILNAGFVVVIVVPSSSVGSNMAADIVSGHLVAFGLCVCQAAVQAPYILEMSGQSVKPTFRYEPDSGPKAESRNLSPTVL
jgi:hypothetical protein